MAEKHLLSLEKQTATQVLFRYATIGICIINEDGIIQMVNPYMEKLFACCNKELIGQPIALLIPEAGRFISSNNHSHFTEDSSATPHINTWAAKKDGSTFPVDISLGQYDSDGQHLTLVFITDLTERTFSDNKFKAIFYKSPVAKSLTDLDSGKFVDVNDNFCRIFGYAREELIGKSPLEINFVDAEKRRQSIEIVKKNGRLINNQLELSTKNNEKVFVLASTEQIEILNKTFLLSTYIDITESKKANEDLQFAKNSLEHEADQLKRLNEASNRLWKIDNLEDGLVEVLNSSIELTKADKGNIQLYDAAKKVLNIKISKGLTREFLEHFKEVNENSPTACGIALKKRAQAITKDTEKERNAEEAAIARNNGYRAVQSTPLLSRDGSPIGMISTHFTNAGGPTASALKRMELYALVVESFIERIKIYETIQKQNLQLEERIAERTRELIAALEHEKDLNDMKSRFVSMASHEFRTPLTAILSSISLVKSYHADENIEKRNRHIARIENSIASLVDILNDFLSLEKLQQGKVEAVLQSFNFHEFAEDIAEEMNGLLKQDQHITLSYKGEEEIRQDKKILRNVMRNLLSNAIKYSGEGKEISLSIEVSSTTIAMQIKDQGIGIAREEQAHLFSTFFRARNVTSIQGTGLGLSIVKKYVELLHGTIGFTSELNEGTTFTVTFPKNGN